MQHDADAQALKAFLTVRPAWRRTAAARALIDLPPDCLLHAGPPFGRQQPVPAPVLNSASVAAVFEGFAATLAEARQRLESGSIRLAAAQDFAVVTPLAAVVSPSMLLHEIVDLAGSASVAYTPINEGAGPAARVGLSDMAVVEHLRWLNGSFAAWLEQAHKAPIELIPLADEALAAGDDCHGRTLSGTARLRRLLAPARGTDSAKFLAEGPSFFLNLWMAACKCMLMAAAGTPGSSLVTAAGANGLTMGIQVAAMPGRWFTAPAQPPMGNLGKWPRERALGAIGDSAIVDTVGFGAMAMAYAPAQLDALGPYMPADGLARPAQLFAARHGAFRRVVLHSGLLARRVVSVGKSPLVSLGMLDAQGEAGRLAGGIFEMPLAPFQEAVDALEGRPGNTSA